MNTRVIIIIYLLINETIILKEREKISFIILIDIKIKRYISNMNNALAFCDYKLVNFYCHRNQLKTHIVFCV